MFLNFFTKQQAPSKDDILNFGLHLLLNSAFKFNPDIKENLRRKYSSITEEDPLIMKAFVTKLNIQDTT